MSMMISIDIFQAADKITEALGIFSDEGIKKAILMALIAKGKEGLLIDPETIKMTQVSKMK